MHLVGTPRQRHCSNHQDIASLAVIFTEQVMNMSKQRDFNIKAESAEVPLRMTDYNFTNPIRNLCKGKDNWKKDEKLTLLYIENRQSMQEPTFEQRKHRPSELGLGKLQKHILKLVCESRESLDDRLHRPNRFDVVATKASLLKDTIPFLGGPFLS
ncbi:hypothetical protein OIU74_009505 [Salix koriyanagi]|uniref:Uncharacterized protein n=1 Tax=Salix koriyanagi TaxID=2511006 RepID=A0A9Q0Z0L2_9ROSI|nr:hypothetical protein OIU74_009505 [Salix koriyanagi]